DHATDRALEFLAKTQRADGSFEAPDVGQPGITSLCVLAFLSRGHVPGVGVQGESLERAIDFVLKTQQQSGLLFPLPLGQAVSGAKTSNVATYSHAISGLMLAEVYGMTEARQQERIRAAIRLAVKFTQNLQRVPKRTPGDEGGWRYLGSTAHLNNDSD